MGFEAIYKQTVTLFNRKIVGEKTYWYPVVIPNVHLIIDRSIIISTYGEQSQDNAKLHIRYAPNGDDAVIAIDGGSRVYMLPKAYRASGDTGTNITFAFGDDFDFIMDGAWNGDTVIDDDEYPKGFFNYMNKTYDNVFAITTVAKFNLIPHFEITAK